MLVVDRNTTDPNGRALRHWVRDGDRLVETGSATVEGEITVELVALPARLWRDGQTLVVETSTGTTRI